MAPPGGVVEAHSTAGCDGCQHRWALCAGVIAAATQTRPLAVTRPAACGLPHRSEKKSRVGRAAAPPIPTEGSVDVVRQHLGGWLPQEEREGLLRFVRLLSLPVESGRLPLLAFLCLRLCVLQLAHKGWQLLQRRLSRRSIRIGTAEQAQAVLEELGADSCLTEDVRLHGHGKVEKGCEILNAWRLGPTLLMGGFQDQRLNTEFYRSGAGTCLKSRSQSNNYVLRSVGPDPELESAEWAIFADGPRAASIAAEAALARSPGRINLWAAPSLGWQESTADGWVEQSEAGVTAAAPPQTPCQIRFLPPNPPRTVQFEQTYFQVAELPVKVWSCGILAVQALELALLRRTKAKRLVGAVVKAMSRVKWAVTVTALTLLVHLAIGRWRERRSRGVATTSDILGSQSSREEARLSAAAIALQAAAWLCWALCAMVISGVDVGSVLLVPTLSALILGFVGKDAIANILSGLVLHLTQPFALGDWITLESGRDGWVRETGVFYTRVVQWDKRPLYVPNFRLIQMPVENNSRMTRRRVKFHLHVRLRDIPKVPAIVSDMQQILDEHSEIDPVEHRLVRWRAVGDYYATIWMSCYAFASLEQPLLERCAGIVYKHGADFASSIERLLPPEAGDPRKSTGRAAGLASKPLEMAPEVGMHPQEGGPATSSPMPSVEAVEGQEKSDVQGQSKSPNDRLQEKVPGLHATEELVPPSHQGLAGPTRAAPAAPSPALAAAAAAGSSELSEEELQLMEDALRTRERHVEKQLEKARTKRRKLDRREAALRAASGGGGGARGAAIDVLPFAHDGGGDLDGADDPSPDSVERS